MSIPSQLASSYRIGGVIVNSDLNLLKRDHEAEPVRVESKVIALLDYLVQRHGQVCSKQQIIDALWPNQLVADDAVTRLIFTLRSALQDDAKSPQFISTVPKKGYVFLLAPTPVTKKQAALRAMTVLALLILTTVLAWLHWPASYGIVKYQVLRSYPVTHEEGREFDYVVRGKLAAYFHQKETHTQLVLSVSQAAPKVLVSDHWQKRSLVLTDNALFYVRYTTDMFQIVQQTLDGEMTVLFQSQTPIYTLSLNPATNHLFFNKYIDNAHIQLMQYSFVDKQVNQAHLPAESGPPKVYSHFYHEPLDTLFFVGENGRKPTIYGIRPITQDVSYRINGFDNIRYLAQGKSEYDLIVVGRHQLTQGIWSVSLESKEISLIASHPDTHITQASYNPANQTLYYSFQGQRVDLKAVSLDGKRHSLPNLNSTLIDNQASYSADGAHLYFVSDRSGDFEAYKYNVATATTTKITNLKATQIWHYSISNAQTHLAIVYSTDHIRLGIVSLKTGKLSHSIALEEIKFPLSWSPDDRHLYVSEHRAQISMYLYEANTLMVKKKRAHLGLTAVPLNDGDIVTFDYDLNRFVEYNFMNDTAIPISDAVTNSHRLAPHNTFSNGQQVMYLNSNDIGKSVYRLSLSKDPTLRTQGLVVNLLDEGKMQAFAPDLSSVLLAYSTRSLEGNIVALNIK